MKWLSYLMPKPFAENTYLLPACFEMYINTDKNKYQELSLEKSAQEAANFAKCSFI